MSLHIETDDSENVDDIKKKAKVSSQKGITIKPLGATPKTRTREKSNCGTDAVQNFAGNLIPASIQFEGKYLQPYIKGLENKGYRFGLTAQVIGYDWRLPHTDDSRKEVFKGIIEDMTLITGKKVMIIGHSYGNLIILNNLLKMEQEFKDKHVLRWIQMGAPFLGSVNPLKLQMGLPLAYKVIQKMRISAQEGTDLIKTIAGFYSLFPRFISRGIKGKAWFKDLLKRTNKDIQNEDFESSDKVIGLFPKFSDKCYKDLDHRENIGCLIGINPSFLQYGSVGGADRINTEESLRNITKKYMAFDKASLLYNLSIDTRISKLENPNVQMVAVYSNILQTESKLYYLTNPKPRSEKGILFDPENVDYSFGDGTVTTASALIHPMKWANDFNEKKKGAKPVIFMDLCSNVNLIDSIFKKPGSFTVQENFYSGVFCESEKDIFGQNKISKGKEHGHSGMLDHKSLRSIIIEAASQNRDESSGIQGKFKHFGDIKWEDYALQCRLLNRD